MAGRTAFWALCVLFSASLARDAMSQPAPGPATMAFKTFVYIDKEGTGIEAFRMLIPSDWVFEGGIRWVLDNPGMPAVAQFRVRNPKGREEFEVFPNQAFFWTSARRTTKSRT